MEVSGVELTWDPASDNNWISRYQIYRNGEPVDTVANGMYYFDFTDGYRNLDSKYEIQAIDGDGNASRKVEATLVQGGPDVYTARGGYLSGKDYSYQGANNWFYEEMDGTKPSLMIWNGSLAHMGLYQGSAAGQRAVIGGSWMRPGTLTDAARVFVSPYPGTVTISGTIHKDIYHTSGDGVRVKVLKNGVRIWPETDWYMIAPSDITGVAMNVTTQVQKGDRLSFVINCNLNAVDDDTVWDPQITYDRWNGREPPVKRALLDDRSTYLAYSGDGWQRLGVDGAFLEHGYVPGRIRGTLSVGSVRGDKVTLRFQGTGVELIGSTGTDQGIANISLDGKPVASIDSFVPARVPGADASSLNREPSHWANVPPIRLWSIHDLKQGPHLIEVSVSGKKNRESAGTRLGIDAFAIIDGSALEQ
jgi:hypothetical protein